MTAYINPRAKLLRHPDRLAAWREGQSFAPLGVEFDLTNRCNLGCEFCHFGYTHSRGPLSHRQRADFAEMGDEIDDALAMRILGEMAAATTIWNALRSSRRRMWAGCSRRANGNCPPIKTD